MANPPKPQIHQGCSRNPFQDLSSPTRGARDLHDGSLEVAEFEVPAAEIQIQNSPSAQSEFKIQIPENGKTAPKGVVKSKLYQQSSETPNET